MKMPSANDFIGAGIFGVELAVAGLIGGYVFSAVILGMVKDDKTKQTLLKYQWFIIALLFIVLGMFVMPKLMYQIGFTLLAFGIMMLLLEEIKKMKEKQ